MKRYYVYADGNRTIYLGACTREQAEQDVFRIIGCNADYSSIESFNSISESLKYYREMLN